MIYIIVCLPTTTVNNYEKEYYSIHPRKYVTSGTKYLEKINRFNTPNFCTVIIEEGLRHKSYKSLKICSLTIDSNSFFYILVVHLFD